MDQAQEQSPSIQDRIGNLVKQEFPREAPQEAQQEAPAEPVAEVPTEEPQITETPPEVVETEPEADWKEVELDGERLQVPAKWEKAFLQEKDYTQKTQGLADQRRLVELREQHIQSQEQALRQLHPLYVQGQVLHDAIQRYEKLDWEALRIQDPQAYGTYRADYATLLQQRGDLSRQIDQANGYLNQQRQAAMAQAAQAAGPIIKKAIPDWGPDKDAQLTKFALANGASPEELSGLASRPWAVVLMEQARKFQELQAQKAQLPKKVSPSPVARPGAKPTLQNAEAASYRKNIEQFRKSGGKDTGALKAVLKAKLAKLGS
jgi:hypothetical protein